MADMIADTPMRNRVARSRGASTPASLALVSLAAIVICVLLLKLNAARETDGGDADVLTVFCAAGLRPAMEGVRARYEEEHGVRIDVNYGGSGSLLSVIRGSGEGDLYIAADLSYLDQARQLGLGAEILPFAWQKPVVAVPKGNPKGLSSLDDLLREDIRVGVANPEAAAVGKCVRTVLRGVGRWKAFAQHFATMKPTVNEVANDVKIGALDAGFTWDATLISYPELEAVELPELGAGERQVGVTVLVSSVAPTAALRFARFLAASDRGLPEFEKRGFRVVDGDKWAEVPRIVLFSGAMLRPGIAETLTAFERREGCEIATQYNGCGLLVSQMRSGTWPDAYVSCDRSFMDMVQSGFLAPHDLAENDLVILVAAGNPKGIRGLVDLKASELRVGLADPDKSALGALTQRVLERAGVAAAVRAGVEVFSPTGDLLVNQMLTGSLDAAVVYRSNARAHPGTVRRLETVEVKVEGATAFQNYAIATGTDHPWLLRRLFERVRDASTRQRFESVGFRWIGQ